MESAAAAAEAEGYELGRVEEGYGQLEGKSQIKGWGMMGE